MVERHTEWVTVEGHELHYVAAGDPDAPPLVLLHGGIIDAAHISWGGLIDQLAAEFRVLAVDLLGYGASDKPDVTYSLDRHVRTVRGALEQLIHESVSIAGISMGGGIGLGVALDAPDLVDRLVLVDSYGLGTELANGRLTYLLSTVQVFNRVAIALFRRSRRLTKAGLGGIVHGAVDEELVDLVHEECSRPGVGRAFRSFRAAEVTREGYRTDFTDRLGTLEVPALLLHGEHDEVFPPAWSRRAADRIPDARLRILSDCAHLAPRERPDAVRGELEDFCA